MKEIINKGVRVCESDFPSKCKKVSKSKEIENEQSALRIRITSDLKLRIQELKNVVSSDSINESITKTSKVSPTNTSTDTPADTSTDTLADTSAETPAETLVETPADISAETLAETSAETPADTSGDTSADIGTEEHQDEDSTGDGEESLEESALSIDKVESVVESVVESLEVDSDDSDNESDTDCIELTTIGGEVLYYEASGNNIYRLDEDGEGVCIGSMEEVLDSSKCACNFNGKDYAIGEEIKSGKEELFRCVITNNVFKRQPKGLKYFGVCRQGADGTCTITKKK
jgi:hypothetical protein